MAYEWDEMIAEFRSLGGVADNIVQATGSLGRGIFPIDRDKPIRIHVPKNLLVPADDIGFADDRVEIRESANVGQPERAFFQRYQIAFSWGLARQECASYVNQIRNMPPGVVHNLFGLDGMERQPDAAEGMARDWFLGSRCIKVDDRLCVMPIMELVNHGIAAKGYDVNEAGVSIEGEFPDEVLVHYTQGDPLSIFLTFGFASPERVCFSLPTVRQGPRNLVIQRRVKFKSKRGSFFAPDVSIEGEKITLSGMMIGNRMAPRLSRGMFVTLMREAGLPEPEMEFDAILHTNRMRFLGLLGAMEPVQGVLAQTVRTMIRFQLEAMSHCIGTREI